MCAPPCVQSPAEQSDAAAARSGAAAAVVAELLSVYSSMFDDGVIRLIAEQSGFDIDTAVATLSAMVDDPQLVAAARSTAATLHHVDSAAQAAAAQQRSSPAAPTSAWKAQPTHLTPTSASPSSAALPRPQLPSSQPLRKPQSSLAAWPSPAEAQSSPRPTAPKQTGATSRTSKAADSSGRATRADTELRVAPASPLSVRSLSPSPLPASLAIRSAPTSPSSALQPDPLERATSATSAHSLSPTSPSSSSSSLTLPTLQHPPPSTTPSHPPVRISLANPATPFFHTRHSRTTAATADAAPRWTTYSASEEDPLYYLLMVREQQERLDREAEEKRRAEEVVDVQDSPVDCQLDGFPSLSLHPSDPQPSPVGQKVTVNASELLELLRTMFEGVDEGLIHSVVASLDCLSVDLSQLNECVTTLTHIVSDDQPGAEVEVSEDAREDKARDSDDHLSDLEIARRMAVDPRFSPPRSTAPRSLLPPSSTSSSSSSLPSSSPARDGSRSRASKVKMDLTKPVYRWAPPTPTDALLSPNLSAQWSLAALYKSFPRVDRAIVDDCFAGHGHHLQRAKEHLLSIFPDEMVGGDVAPLPSLLPVQDRARRAGEPPLPTRLKQANPHPDDADGDGVGLIPDAVLERELGPVLDNHSIPHLPYPSHFSSSIPSSSSSPATHANRRAAYFRAAAEAFLAGKGGLAREYARRGKEEGAMMVESGVKDAVRVFREANRDVDCHKRVDLHGQRVAEALCIVDFAVRRLRRRGVGDLVVVTGRGRNSVGGKSRLKPAVLSYCLRRGFKYSHVNDAEVKMSWR